MNFIPVTLISKNNESFAVFEDKRIKIPEGKIKKLKDSSYLGRGGYYGNPP